MSVGVNTETGTPVSIRWSAGVVDRVRRTLDAWVLRGRWWERDDRRVYLLVETERRRVVELERRGPASWRVLRVHD